MAQSNDVDRRSRWRVGRAHQSAHCGSLAAGVVATGFLTSARASGGGVSIWRWLPNLPVPLNRLIRKNLREIAFRRSTSSAGADPQWPHWAGAYRGCCHRPRSSRSLSSRCSRSPPARSRCSDSMARPGMKRYRMMPLLMDGESCWLRMRRSSRSLCSLALPCFRYPAPLARRSSLWPSAMACPSRTTSPATLAVSNSVHRLGDALEPDHSRW